MVRVRVCIFLLPAFLSGCAAERAQTAASAQQQAAEPPAKENILACTGLPVAGQKCGLALPKP
jgi:hypothetical protein